jgi:hypothetical protein
MFSETKTSEALHLPQQLKYVPLYFLIILTTSSYSLSYVSLRLCTGHHLQSTIYTVLCLFDISSDKIIGSLLIGSGNEIEVLEICNEDSKTHSSSDIVI